MCARRFIKNFLGILFLGLSLIMLNACAKPTVLDVTLPDDEKLNCEELKEGYAETRRFRKEAEAVREVNTGGNMTRTMLFWPALLKTLHNADVAIDAANNRAYHLIGIMKNKNCKEADKLFAELTKKTSPIYVSREIKKLYNLYRKGILTEEEFQMAKNKVLSQ